ncbi:type III pantothenate kinase, partial [bacterium]|nr:type III pantothenate kinase [bacterium]
MNHPGQFLLVNVNNTNTSFAVATAGRIVRVRRVPTGSVRTVPWTRRRWAGVVLASVVPAVARRLRPLLPRPLVSVGPDLDLGVGIEYPEPDQIGADRLANAVGVAELYGAPAIVVDFG